MNDESDAKNLVARLNKVWVDRVAAQRARLRLAEQAFISVAAWLEAVRKELIASGGQASLSFSGWELGGQNEPVVTIELLIGRSKRSQIVFISYNEKNEFEFDGKTYAFPEDLARAKERLKERVFEILSAE